MAKVSGPLLSMDASGQIGKAMVFSKWKGRNYVRNYVRPANPQTPAQQESREALGAGGRFNSFVEEGSTADGVYKGLAPAGQSGASFFVRRQIQSYSTSKTDYNNVTYADEKGYFDSAAATLGIAPITIPGDTPEVVPAGLILWNAYQASHVLDDTLADTPATTATAMEITEFVGLLSDV